MLLVVMSLEKCFAVYFPLKSKSVCTVKTAKWVTGIFGVILAGCNSVYFFLRKTQIDKKSAYMKCVYISHSQTLNMIDSILYSFFPLFLMFMTNFSIVFKLLRAKCKNNPSNSIESTSQALSKAATRGTAMVVTVSLTFLILTVPNGVRRAVKPVIDLWSYPESRAFLTLTQYLNHSINGYLYCIVGSRFRTELLKIFCRKDKRENSSTIYSINSSNLTEVTEITA